MNEDISRILIGETELRGRVRELGRQISADFRGDEPVLVGVLKGSVIFLADLMREISIPLALDFLSISSYSGDAQTGVVKILKDLDGSIRQRRVIIVEDILDTGLTLDYIVKTLRARNPVELRICALLDKKCRRLVEIPVDYRGFEIPDEFVVGYGMDYNERYRNLPFIGTLKKEIIRESKG